MWHGMSGRSHLAHTHVLGTDRDSPGSGVGPPLVLGTPHRDVSRRRGGERREAAAAKAGGSPKHGGEVDWAEAPRPVDSPRVPSRLNPHCRCAPLLPCRLNPQRRICPRLTPERSPPKICATIKGVFATLSPPRLAAHLRRSRRPSPQKHASGAEIPLPLASHDTQFLESIRSFTRRRWP